MSNSPYHLRVWKVFLVAMQLILFTNERLEGFIKFMATEFHHPRIKFYYSVILLFLTSFVDGTIVINDGNQYIDEFADHELPFSLPIPNYGIKILHSAVAGFTAAVIYNLKERENNEEFYVHHQEYTDNISAVSVKRKSGLIILDHYLFTVDPRIRIVIFHQFTFNAWTKILFFSVVAGVFIIVLLYFMLVRFFQRRRPFERTHLNKEHIRRLKSVRYKIGNPHETCAICLEDYKTKEKLRILPCSHGFHAKCIDPWLLRRSQICPVCKQIVVLANEISENGTESDTENRSETAPLLRDFLYFGSYRGIANDNNHQSESQMT